MKRRLLLGLLVVMVMAGTWFCYADKETSGTSKAKTTSVSMNLTFGTVAGMMESNFRNSRGEDSDKGTFNVLEDGIYPGKENTVLYTSNAKAAGLDKFTSPPNITWTVKRESADGTDLLMSTDNTNMAKNDTMFPDPGIYKVENDGSRSGEEGGQEGSAPTGDGSTSDSGSGDTTGDGSTSDSGSGDTTGDGLTSDSGSGDTTGDGSTSDSGSGATPGGSAQTVTASNLCTVIVHDITAPNLFALFQEGVGAIELAKSEEDLKKQFEDQLTELGGKMDVETKLTGNLKAASILGVVETPKDAPIDQKTAAVVLMGTMFDKDGHQINEEGKKVTANILDKAQETRIITVGAESVSGVFVRRNVPFLVIAKQTDNDLAGPKDVTYTIQEKETGKEVAKTDGAYLFRVANYPHENYQDQPEYVFVASSIDKVGNKTTINVPLNIVNTQASFEAGKTE